MKRKAKAKRRKQSPRPKPKLTLEQVVVAARAAGASVSISMPPIKLTPQQEQTLAAGGQVSVDLTQAPARPRLDYKDWPGDPTCRSLIADIDYDEKLIAKVFKDNPTSRWVVTPFEVFERGKFFQPVPVPQTQTQTETTDNPS